MTDTKNLHIDLRDWRVCFLKLSAVNAPFVQLVTKLMRHSAQMGNLGEQNKLHLEFSLGFN